jgi:hypothetical protein
MMQKTKEFITTAAPIACRGDLLRVGKQTFRISAVENSTTVMVEPARWYHVVLAEITACRRLMRRPTLVRRLWQASSVLGAVVVVGRLSFGSHHQGIWLWLELAFLFLSTCLWARLAFLLYRESRE